MAAPHVTGAAAVVLARNPSYTPQQVRDYLVTNATNGVVTDPGTGSPNKLLYLGCSETNDTNVTISDNINQTYTRDLSSEVANGTWKLRVQDAASQDVGYLDYWGLSL